MNSQLLNIPRRLLALCMVFAVSACGGGSAESPVIEPFYPEASAEWQLVWSDEFDGSALDAGNWEVQTGDGSQYGLTRWGNDELQWYTPDNLVVEDGILRVEARSEQAQAGFPYTSGRIRSLGKLDFQYGRVEARIRSASGKGLWSAFWMLPSDDRFGGWASGGEIDIMEVVNAGTAEENYYASLHHGFAWPLNQTTTESIGIADPAGDFHIYSIEWTADYIRWFVDGRNFMTVDAEHWYSYYYAGEQAGYEAGEGTAPFDRPFHLLINLAVGGNLPGKVNPGAVPSAMEVDYVRVYECAYGQASGAGCNSEADRTVESPGAQAPFMASFPLYTDGPDALSWVIGADTLIRELVIEASDDAGAPQFSEVEVEGRGAVIEVTSSGQGNISIGPADGDDVALFGFGNNPLYYQEHAGELKFDLYIDSAATDLDGTLRVKMESGFPALGFKDFEMAALPTDQWFTLSVKLNDLLENGGRRRLDTTRLTKLLVLEPTANARLMMDNVELACGHPSRKGCGIRPPGGDVDGSLVPVLTSEGAVGPLWDRGICGYDTLVNGDYCGDGNTTNLVNWTLTDSGDPEIGTALMVNYANSGADGLMFFGSAGGVDLSDFVKGGKVIFDLRLPAATVASGMVYKVDCFYPCGTGDQQIDLSDYEADTWQTFEVPVAQLVGSGLDVTSVNAGLVLFPTWGDQQGLSFEVANIRYEAEGSGEPEIPSAVVFADGVVDGRWEDGIAAFDESIDYGECVNDGGAACPSVDWELVEVEDRGEVLQVSHGADFAGLFFKTSLGADMTDYAEGGLRFDIRVLDAGTNTSGFVMKVDCFFPCTSGDQALGVIGVEGWQTVQVSVAQLVAGGLDLFQVNTGLVIFPAFGETDGVVYQIDNIEWRADDTPPVQAQEQLVFAEGVADPLWDRGIAGFDEAISYNSCVGAGGAGCPNLAWELVDDEDPDRGEVLEITHGPQFAGLFFESSQGRDLSSFAPGFLAFDIKVVQEGENYGGFVMKADCFFPCSSGDQEIGNVGLDGWETVEVPVAQLAAGGLNLTRVNTGLTIFPVFGETEGVIYRLDNVRWVVE